jgi:hypothetical protein
MVGFASLYPPYKANKGSGTPTNVDSTTAPAGAARVQRDALACRRSTTALATATERHLQLTRFLGWNE